MAPYTFDETDLPGEVADEPATLTDIVLLNLRVTISRQDEHHTVTEVTTDDSTLPIPPFATHSEKRYILFESGDLALDLIAYTIDEGGAVTERN